jgi:hypothetical protein
VYGKAQKFIQKTFSIINFQLMSKWKKFTDGQLSEQETDAFLRKSMTKGFDEAQKKEWGSRLSEEYGIHRHPPKPKLRGLVYVGALAAAIALFLLAYPLFLSQPAGLEQQLELALAEPFPNYLTRKGEIEQTEALRQQMAEAYNAKNYEKAVDIGQQLIQSSNRQTEDLFFLGLSYLYQRNLPSSIDQLEKARSLSEQEGRFQEEIDWYLALAYLKNENWDQGKALLSTIVEQEQWNAGKARKLLKDIH